jgi:hypothetical protein
MAARLTERIPVLSAGSITAATRWGSPLAAGQASAGVPMVVGSPAAGSMVEVVGSMVEVEEVTDENGPGFTVKSIRRGV